MAEHAGISKPSSTSGASSSDDAARPCCVECRAHFCRRPNPKQAAAISATVIALFTVVILTITGHTQLASRAIGTLGVGGQAIFVVLLIYTGMPFGYGYSFTIGAVGYTYGWWGLIPVQIGCVLGAVAGHVVSRWCMRSTVEKKVASLPPLWVSRLTLLRAEIRHSYLGFFFVTGLLHNCVVLTFGICNALDAVLFDVSLPLSLAGTFLACQPSNFFSLYLGTLVDALETAVTSGDGAAAANSSSNVSALNSTAIAEQRAAQTASVVAQVCLVLALLCGVAWWARRTLRRITEKRLEPQPQPPAND
jgi:uncharacterized membrane protein YdjX (TVP38/TMEM64 family)